MLNLLSSFFFFLNFRYEAICFPLQSCVALHRVRRIIIICWLSSLIVAIPQLLIFEKSLVPDSLTKYRCASTGYAAEWQHRVYFTLFAFYILILPACYMTRCYIKIIRAISPETRNFLYKNYGKQKTKPLKASLTTLSAKVKTVKLAITIMIVFVTCWTPYILVTLLEIYSNRNIRIPLWLDGILKTICLAQIGVNPFIYTIFYHRRKCSSRILF